MKLRILVDVNLVSQKVNAGRSGSERVQHMLLHRSMKLRHILETEVQSNFPNFPNPTAVLI